MNRDERRVSRKWLAKFGSMWAVLTAMAADCGKRGASIPPEVSGALALARTKIESGRFSPCEMGSALEKVERQLVALGAPFGEGYLRLWCDLFGQAMEGRIDQRRISGIPALASVVAGCEFLACRSGEANRLSGV